MARFISPFSPAGWKNQAGQLRQDGQMKSETPGPRVGQRTEPELRDGANRGVRRGEKEEWIEGTRWES